MRLNRDESRHNETTTPIRALRPSRRTKAVFVGQQFSVHLGIMQIRLARQRGWLNTRHRDKWNYEDRVILRSKKRDTERENSRDSCDGRSMKNKQKNNKERGKRKKREKRKEEERRLTVGYASRRTDCIIRRCREMPLVAVRHSSITFRLSQSNYPHLAQRSSELTVSVICAIKRQPWPRITSVVGKRVFSEGLSIPICRRIGAVR